MNWDQVEGKWKQFAGRFREKWGKLTDDDLQVIGGKKDQLVGKIQERYGMAREQAQREVDDYVNTLRADASDTQDETQGVAGRARRAGQP
jgi:uncharacterized protein YjbJ (UPF0337 family)